MEKNDLTKQVPQGGRERVFAVGKVYVLERKVFINCAGYDVMSASASEIIGVFHDINDARYFAQQVADSITDCCGQHRTFLMYRNKHDKNKRLEFAIAQVETALYPRFVFECTCEQILS